MPYPIEYWQALLDRRNEEITSNRAPSSKSYFQYSTGQTGRAIYASFNGKSKEFDINLNQNVNLHFHDWTDSEEPLTGVREAIGNLPEGTFFFKEILDNKNEGYKYWLVRSLDFNMSKTDWGALKETQREELLT